MKALLLLLCTCSWLVRDATAAGIRRGFAENGDNNNENKRSPIHTHTDRTIHDVMLTSDHEPVSTSLNNDRNLYDLFVLPPYDVYDLGVRFSKIHFPDTSIDTSRLPLTASDFPIQMETALWLSQSQCPSVVIPEICPECEAYDFEDLVKEIGGPPTHASRHPSAEFWTELLEVVERQEERKANVSASTVLPLPYIWKDYNLSQVAEAVHDEYPGLHHQALIEYLLQNGATVDNTTIPQLCNTEFLRGIVMLAHLNTWAISKVGPVNFAVKYHEGRARPEEIAYKISTRELSEENGVPQVLLDKIPRGSIPYATNFTAYPEGSPMHPSWPAMHSAASVGSLWLAVVMNLTEDQHCQAMLVDYGVAYARTVAGVHYASDNIAGLKLGCKLVADYLPDYLNETYGSDPDVVRAKIDTIKVEWDDFLTSKCYLDNIGK